MPPESVTRPISPDSPEIISELQRYTVGAGAGAQNPAAGQQERAPESITGVGVNMNNMAPTKLGQSNGSSASFASGNISMLKSHHDVSVANTVQPSMDATAAQDLRTGSKRKASTPSMDERTNKQPATGKHSSAALASQAFPFSGGYGLPPLGLSPAMLGSIGGSLGHQLFMGAGSPYFQPPHGQLGDPCLMYPDPFGLGGAGAVPASSSSPLLTTTAAAANSSSSAASSVSVKAASSVSGALPPFMLSPSMAGMAGMLPPGFPLSYSQSLASLYAGSMLPGGLPGSAATPGPAGASYLSHYPPTAVSTSSSSSPASSSPSTRSESHRGSVLVENGGNISGTGSSDDDDDVIEVMGQ